MRSLLPLMLLIAALTAGGAERKGIGAVVSDQLVKETQHVASGDGRLVLVWWIPTEFWEASILRANPQATVAAEEVRRIFSKLALIGVVHAEQTPLGSFAFTPRERITPRVRVHLLGAGGSPAELIAAGEPDKDAKLMLERVKPVLASLIGEMGANFHLLLFTAPDAGEKPLASPYETGRLRVTLLATETEPQRVVEFETPLDSLFVPRLCPNGKPAHITWKVCPWDGTRLPE